MDGCSRVIYVSRSRYLSHTIAPILAWSKLHVQSLAVYGHGYFFQWAEGSPQHIETLLSQLTLLPEGFQLCVLSYEYQVAPTLSAWRTHYELEGMDIEQLLTSQGMQTEQATLLVDLMDAFRQTHQIAPNPAARFNG